MVISAFDHYDNPVMAAERPQRVQFYEGDWIDGGSFELRIRQGIEDRPAILQCKVNGARGTTGTWTADEDGP